MAQEKMREAESENFQVDFFLLGLKYTENIYHFNNCKYAIHFNDISAFTNAYQFIFMQLSSLFTSRTFRYL